MNVFFNSILILTKVEYGNYSVHHVVSYRPHPRPLPYKGGELLPPSPPSEAAAALTAAWGTP